MTSERTDRRQEQSLFSWYLTFSILCVGIFAVVYLATGLDAIGAAMRFLWNGLVFVANGLIRLVGSMLLIISKGVGLRRVSRLANMVLGVGLGYAGSVILSDAAVKKAHGWRGKLMAAITLTRNRWTSLHLGWKLAIVAVLIASQVYLHTLLIVFPIAFLVPVVRRLWIQVADLLFGSWYWRKFGQFHRSAVATLQTLPVVRSVIGAGRLTRLRYLCAWRLWKYDPRYRDPLTARRRLSMTEPMRLWWRGELDRYVGSPLLSGRRAPLPRPSIPPLGDTCVQTSIAHRPRTARSA